MLKDSRCKFLEKIKTMFSIFINLHFIKKNYQMLEKINIEQILFLDIETVPLFHQYQSQPENLKTLWDKKAEHLKRKEDDNAETLYGKAGIYAEFGKIICISVGYFRNQEFRIKSFYGDDEKELLKDFISLLNRYFNARENLLCGHNAKEFDFPYLSRRMLINGLQIPEMLDTAGKKPWEVNHLDTMDLWRFGDYKSYTSLELLTTVFNIPTSKDDINGSDVARVYWEEKDLERIAVYCEKDVLNVAQIFLRYQGKPLIKQENIIHA